MISSKRKIVFDASVLVSGQVSGDIHKTGLYRFSYEVLKELNKLELFEIYLFDIFHREREIKKYVQPLFNNCKRIYIYSKWYRLLVFPFVDITDKLRDSQSSHRFLFVRSVSGFLKNLFLFIEKAPRFIERKYFINSRLIKQVNGCTLYYSTYFPIPLLIRENEKIQKVYTIHDLIPILHPDFFSSPFNNRILKEVIDNITHKDSIIAVSDSTKRDILNYRKDLKEEQIQVSLLGASEKFSKVASLSIIEECKLKYEIKSNRYILSVCTIEPRKNLIELIKAFRWLLENTVDFDMKLVLTGAQGWGTGSLFDDITDINRLYHNPIIITGFIPDEDLAILYNGALMFVYPSLYEGFGLPVLEAMQCGVPVITSNVSSLPELVGDSGLLVDPTDTNSLVRGIMMLAYDEPLRQTYINRSLARAECFSWRKTSDIIVETLNQHFK